ncbi:MAG TPA: hypothetical protein VIE69_00540 [Methylophilaceae bacterium]
MSISSIFDFLNPPVSNVKKSWWLQGQSVGDALKKAASDAAAKRKALAAERLKALSERLRVLMLLSSADGKNSKGNITAAAGIAREIAATVKDYAGASADIAAQSATSSDGSTASAIGDSTAAATAGASLNITATATTIPLSNEDEAFLNTAVQLSSQVRFFISQEVQKAKQKHQDPDTHQSDINIMDNAIIDAAKSFGVTTDGTTVYPKPFNSTFISIMT